ncbi:MAG: DUF5522 domain-containing protein [Bacteroidota bacterium]
MKSSQKEKTSKPSNENFYIDKNGLVVFTEKFHLDRGFCCKNGCKHCPYKQQ